MESQSTQADKSALKQPESSESQFGQHPLQASGLGDAGGGAPPMTPPPLNLGGDDAPIQGRFGSRVRNRFSSAFGGGQNSSGSTPSSQNTPSPENPSQEHSPAGGGRQDWFMKAYWKQHAAIQAVFSQLQNSLNQNTPAQSGETPSDGEKAQNNSEGNLQQERVPEHQKEGFMFEGYNIPKLDPISHLRQTPEGAGGGLTPKLNAIKTAKKQTETADVKVGKSKAAAVAPSEEPKSHEAKDKVESINNQGKPSVSGANAKSEFASKLDSILPNDEDDARSFIQNDRGKEATNIAKNAVESQKLTVSSRYGGISDLPGNTQAQQHTPLGPNESAGTVETQNLGEGAWAPLQAEHADFSEIIDSVENQLEQVELMQGVLDGDESAYALAIKEDLDPLAAEIEAYDVSQLQTEVDAKTANFGTDMNTAQAERSTQIDTIRETNLNLARAEQDIAKGNFETERQSLTTQINTRYGSAETEVTRLLGELNANMSGLEGEINTAVTQFYDESDDMFDDLVGLGGGISGWDWGKFTAEWAHETFKTRINAIVDKFTGFITTAVDACHAEIDSAKTDIEGYISTFETNVGTLEDGAYDNIFAKLETLRTEVDAEVERLREDFETNKEAAVTEVEEYVASFANPWKILAQGLLDIILSGGEAALRFMLKIFGVANADAFIDELVRIAGIIGDILRDPIGFAKNLFTVISNTFTDYFQNIGENLQEIVMTWFFGRPDLELPNDFSAESWMKFSMDASGLNADSVQSMISADLQLPGGITIDPIGPLQALVTGGPSALWDNLKTQLNTIPFVEIDGGESGTSPAAPVEGNDEAEVSEGDIVADVSQMNWTSFLTEAEQFLPEGTVDQLENASYIYHQFMSGQIPDLINDMAAEMGEEFNNIPKLLMDEIFEWVKTDMLQQLPLLVATFVNPAGGIAKAIKAVYDGIMWCIQNKEAIWDVIQSIFGSLSQVAAGNLEGAQAAITSGINQGIGLLLDLLTEVVVSSSPSQKLGKIVENLSKKAEAAFQKLMDKIKAAFNKFIESIQKMLGQRKKDKKRGSGEQETQELDYKEVPIPSADRIVSKINNLEGRVLDKAPESFNLPDYTSEYSTAKKYEGQKKTYKVLQALLDLYREDDTELADNLISKEEGLALAADIRSRHPVFKTFTVVQHDETQNATSFSPDDNAEYWAYEWVASDPKNAPAGEQEESVGGDSFTESGAYKLSLLAGAKSKNSAFDLNDYGKANALQNSRSLCQEFARAIFDVALEKDDSDYNIVRPKLRQAFYNSAMSDWAVNVDLTITDSSSRNERRMDGSNIQFLSDALYNLYQNSTTRPGGLESSHNTYIEQEDLNVEELLQLMRKKRSRTRYSFDHNNNNQGPHTVARMMGIDALVAKFNSKKSVEPSKMQDWFTDSIIPADELRDHMDHYDPNSEYVKTYNEWYSKFSSADNYNKSLTGDALQKAKREAQKAVLIYGQILTDLNPYASSFVMDASHEQVAGKGESKPLQELRKLSLYPAGRASTAAHLLSIVRGGDGKEGLVDGKSTLDGIDPSDTEKINAMKRHVNKVIQRNLDLMNFDNAKLVIFFENVPEANESDEPPAKKPNLGPAEEVESAFSG